MDLVSLWYRNPVVLYKLSRRLVGRELAFLGKPTVRGLKAHSSSFLRRHFERFDVYKNGPLVYHSIAHLSGMPVFSYNFADRKVQTEDFFKNYDRYVVNYDFVIDIDNEDLRLAYDDMMVIRRLFLQYGIRHEVVFSGKKGFHIEVKNINHFSFDLDKVSSYFRDLALAIKRHYRVDSLDENIYDAVRIWKAPYSLDTRTGLVVLPLSDDEISNFSVDLCRPERLLKGLRSRADFYNSPGDPENIYKLGRELIGV